MAYSKQNFVDRQVLTHTHLNNIENGIIDVEGDISAINEQIAKKIGFVRTLTSADDMNDIKTDGVYVYSTSSLPVNAPYENAAIVFVFGSTSTSSQKVQIGIRYGNAGHMTFRALYNGSWQNWTEVMVNNNGLLSVPKMEIAYESREQFVQDGSYGFNLRNSDIYRVNAIYFGDSPSEDTSNLFYEGLNFGRSDGKWDSIRVVDGAFKITTGSTNDFGENNAAAGTEGTVDYLVASGTSGIWTYRKWNSGVAECWGTTTTKGTSGTSSLGTATNMPYQMYNATFPFTFKSAPVVTVGAIDGGTGLAVGGISGEATTTSVTAEIVGTQSAIESGCCLYAIGKWK
jgi:hypothetical protein